MTTVWLTPFSSFHCLVCGLLLGRTDQSRFIKGNIAIKLPTTINCDNRSCVGEYKIETLIKPVAEIKTISISFSKIYHPQLLHCPYCRGAIMRTKYMVSQVVPALPEETTHEVSCKDCKRRYRF